MPDRSSPRTSSRWTTRTRSALPDRARAGHRAARAGPCGARPPRGPGPRGRRQNCAGYNRLHEREPGRKPSPCYRRVGRDRRGHRPRAARPRRHRRRHRPARGRAGPHDGRAGRSDRGAVRRPGRGRRRGGVAGARRADRHPGCQRCPARVGALRLVHRGRGGPGAGREPARSAAPGARAGPSDGRARLGPPGVHLVAVGQDRQPRQLAVLGNQVRPAWLSRSACARIWWARAWA